MEQIIYQKSNFFNKISPNLIGYIITFLNHKDVIESSLINKRFKRALNSEYLWETLILQNELFVDNDKEAFSSWKKLYFTLYKLKSNIIGGKPNIGFKMKPLRGHKAIVTSLVVYEKSTIDYVIISGDKNGNVVYWKKNEEEEFESVEIVKANSEIVDIKLINLNDVNNSNLFKNKNFEYKEEEKSLLIATSKDCSSSKKIII